MYGVTRGSPLFPETTKKHRVYRGLTERQEHVFTWLAVIVVLLMTMAWIGAIATIRRQQQEAVRLRAESGVTMPILSGSPTRQITSALLDGSEPKTAYIDDAMLAFLDPLRGESGELRFVTRQPNAPITEEAPENATAVLEGSNRSENSPDFAAPANPGIYKLAVQIDQATRAVEELNVITLVPLSDKKSGRIGLYYLGSWPFEQGGKPKSPAYATPSGFIEVTQQNQDTHVSEHFRLRDFLTKDQGNVWPKYLPLRSNLVDKLELIIQELEQQGIKVDHMQVMSGFRTPQYNHTGGNTAGRANLSRHMYGDAGDVFVDNDRNETMDDLNRDGKIDTRDADVIAQAAERVEHKHPSLVGGIGVYTACCGHGPFTHIDVRGYRARWRGTGNG